MIRNSIKQLFRTPVKAILFLLLLMAAGMFLSLGGNLWVMNSRNMKYYEENFITIGTVEQHPASIEELRVWDAELMEDRVYLRSQYGEALPVSVLDFEGADYLITPEKRPYYGSYAPDYLLQDRYYTPLTIVEFSPVEDCIPDHPVQIEIGRVIWGRGFYEGEIKWFCDHKNETPLPLYKDKTYVFAPFRGRSHNSTDGSDSEYIPIGTNGIKQYDMEGNRLDSAESEENYMEVTKGFYDTGYGKNMIETAKAQDRLIETQPVTGTNATILLMPFYTGDGFICDGRDITEEEYSMGSKVCLIPKKFADNNNLLVGDSVHLQLFYANYRKSAGEEFTPDYVTSGSIGVLNVNGEMYPVFENSMYTVVGIYNLAPGAARGAYGMGQDEVVIPSNSIENSDENSIADYGPMKGNTTSFRITNGSVETFMEEWAKYGIDELEITFYDRGYSQLKAGLDSMKIMSRILLVVGLVMVIFILLFFCHLFISRQRVRTAVERSLGMGKGHCMVSILSGLILILFLGSTIGTGLGGFLSTKLSAESFSHTYYDSAYTSSMIEWNTEEELNSEIGENKSLILLICLFSEVIIILFGSIIAIYEMKQNLKQEPMRLLTAISE